MSKPFDFSNEGFTNLLKNGSKPKLAMPTSMDAGPQQQKVEMIDLDWDGSVAKVVTELGYNCGAPLARARFETGHKAYKITS